MKGSLNWSEMVTAAMLGVLRQVSCMMKRSEHVGRPVLEPWDANINGALAEAAFAKVAGLYWGHDVDTFTSKPDVSRYQVRSTKRKNGCLILHDWDKDDEAAFLVITDFPAFEVAGWIWPKEGKKPEYLKSPPGGFTAYFVPQHALHHMTEWEP